MTGCTPSSAFTTRNALPIIAAVVVFPAFIAWGGITTDSRKEERSRRDHPHLWLKTVSERRFDEAQKEAEEAQKEQMHKE